MTKLARLQIVETAIAHASDKILTQRRLDIDILTRFPKVKNHVAHHTFGHKIIMQITDSNDAQHIIVGIKYILISMLVALFQILNDQGFH